MTAPDVETLPRSLCGGCGLLRFGVRACTVGETTRDLCRRCRVALGGELIAPEATTLPYVAPEPDVSCICGPSPTHAGFCPVAEART